MIQNIDIALSNTRTLTKACSMTRTIHVITENKIAAIKVAALIASGVLPDLYPNSDSAARSLRNYPLPMRSRYQTYETRWTGFKVELSSQEERP